MLPGGGTRLGRGDVHDVVSRLRGSNSDRFATIAGWFFRGEVPVAVSEMSHLVSLLEAEQYCCRFWSATAFWRS